MTSSLHCRTRWLDSVLVSAGVAVLGLALWWTVPWQEPKISIGGPFMLQSSIGETVTDRSMKGRAFILLFGFTHCPDICPTTLFQISEGFRFAGPAAQKIPVLFVTVDPERDSTDILSSYLQSFAPNIIGLSGTREQTKLILSAYRAFSRRVESTSGWTFDHSSMVYLIDSAGRFVGTLSLEQSPSKLGRTLDLHASR
jgi:protein SCO1